MDRTRRTIGSIARTVYAQGPYAQLEVILESANPGDFAERLQSVRTVVKGQDKALGRLGEQRADLERRKEQLQAAQAQVEKRRQEAEDRRRQAEAIAQQAEAVKKRIDALVRARADALRVADREKATTQRQLAALKKEQDRLAVLLSSTGDARRYPSGALQWPAPGPVSQGVGPRVHPVYGYASCHTGIDISVGSGVPIRSAAAGTVVDTRSGGPYGLHTIVDHGDGLATMYAHQSRFGVSPGQRVAKGEVIGYVGSTGYSTGPHLHFEVWVSGRPFDPMGWFGGVRRAVVC
jgi:murein DD-endopeptidase MepM/ murein hydrolase activator NlpD